jgi:hypothetical protein
MAKRSGRARSLAASSTPAGTLQNLAVAHGYTRFMANTDPQRQPGYERQPKYEKIVRLGPEHYGMTVRLDDGRVVIHELGSLPPPPRSAKPS